MKSKSDLTSNERSEGSELISEMNKLFDKNNWGMRKAVGELSLKTQNAKDKRNSTLFPDVIIFKDEYKLLPLMGWELKMPDIPINDEEFISNARDKADRLGTGVFVLWNYQYVSIYIKTDQDEWPNIPTKIFDNYSKVFVNRKSVSENQLVWKKQLEEVIIYLNKELLANKFSSAPIEFNISNYVNTISDKLAPLTAAHYKIQSDIKLKKYIDYWVKNEKAELSTISEIDNEDKSYLAFAKNIIIKWINRILFSHLLKDYHNGINNLLITFSDNEDIEELALLYNEEVEITDFYTILSVDKYETILPEEVISSINEFNIFLSSTDFSKAGLNFVSNVLEEIVDVSKRELMGLYTTPKNLAQLLVSLTIDKSEGEYADLAVGSGTISRAIIDYITKYNSLDYAHNHVWSSDKYNYPLQIANLSITSPDSINKKNIVFQSDILDLNTNDIISIVNPMSGEKEDLEVPKFNYIISNLPFISSNNRTESEKLKISKFISKYSIDKKSDLYQILILKYKELLDEKNGRIGVITSNSWFKTQKNYNSFYKTLSNYYDIEYIIYSNDGRWYNSAEVVSTIIIMKNKLSKSNSPTKFISLNINPNSISYNEINELADSIIFEDNNKLFNLTEYEYNQVVDFINLGLSLEPLFDDINWISKIKSALISIDSIFESSRGVRSGSDKIFISDKQVVDREYSYPILKSLSKIKSYNIDNIEHYYFYTRDNLDTIKEKGNLKTYNYINSISKSPDAIKRKNKKYWYQADQRPQFADFATSINPEKRFFWIMFNEQTVVNQRVTAFRLKETFKKDRTLMHALLNTSLSILMLMGSGFGRALGATDLTKDGISQSYILNPNLLSKKSKNEILIAWDSVKDKIVVNIDEQLKDLDWIYFNKLVYREFNLPDDIYELSCNNIVRLLNRRLSFKGNVN